MDTGIKDLASNLFRGGDEVDRLLGLPMTQMRIELKNRFQDKEFTEDQFNDFVDRLAKIDNISSQADVAKKAVAARGVGDELDIELNSPAKQLLWAAVLTRMMHTGDKTTGPVSRSPLWRQLQGTLGVQNEEISIARLISRTLQNPETVFEWGDQGSWFFYNPKTNRINIDMYYTLLMGFEHTRAAIGHEVGHSQLSNSYSKKMKELYEKVKIIVDPSTITREDKNDKKKRPRIKMKRAEYRQLMLDVAEWQLRFKLWHMVEDSAVNQYSANLEYIINQDFGKSLNYLATALQGFGEIMGGLDENRDIRIATDKAPPAPGTHEREVWDDRQKDLKDKAVAKRAERLKREKTPLTDDELKDIKSGKMTKEIAVKMFEQMNTAVLLAFYEQNGLFKGTDKAWERLRILPEDVRRAVDVSNIPGAKGKDAFEYLIDLAVGQREPDRELIRIPLERQRALKHLEKLAVDEELVNLPAGREAVIDYLVDKDRQGTVKKVFADLKLGIGQPVKKSPEQIANDVARQILERPGILGKEEAAKINDPLEELFRLQAEIPQKRIDKARELLARSTVIGPEAAAKVEDPIEELFQQMARAWGVRNLQPNPSDRILQHEPYKTLGDSYRAVVAFTSEQRGRVMDHIWDTFLQPYAEVILKARAEKLDRDQQKKQEQKKQDKQKGKPQKGDGQQQQPQDGEGDEGEQQDSGGGGGDSSPDIDDDDDNQNGQGKQDSGIEIEDEENDGSGDNDDVELDDDDLDDIGELNEDPEKGHGEDGHDHSQPDDKNENDQDGDKSGWDKDDMPPPQRKDKKVGDLKDKEPTDENLTDEQKEAAKKAAEQRKQDEQNGVKVGDNGQATDFDTSQYATGKWTDFYDRMRELMPVILHREAIYRKVLAEQRQSLRKQSVEKHTLLPTDGDFRGRLDKQRVLNKLFKKATHQPFDLEDLKQIRDDKTEYVDSSIESMSLIDGSGSMKLLKVGRDASGRDITAMDVAIQSAAIDYLAARRAEIGAYLIMWGKDTPYIIATPSTPLEIVGERLEGVREGLSSATALAPGLVSSIEELGNFINKKGTISGTSLMTIYSDGEIQDFNKALEALGKITKAAKNLSIEVAVLTDKSTDASKKTKMEELFEQEKEHSGERIVSIMRGNDAREIPIHVGRRTLERLRKFKVQLEDDKVKRARFKRIARDLKELK